MLPGVPEDPERSLVEANRRARSKLRRYCVANRLNRMGTLTYAGAGNHDPGVLRAHVGEFWVGLRGALGGKALPYVWVPEWHPGGHGLHVHFAVGRYIKQGLIAEVWGRGHVHIKRHQDLPVGSTDADEARIAAGYLAKYVGKGFDDPYARAPGLHRYEVAQGFQPATVQVAGGSLGSALRKAEFVVGRPQRHLWRSSDERDWRGPPVVWVQY